MKQAQKNIFMVLILSILFTEVHNYTPNPFDPFYPYPELPDYPHFIMPIIPRIPEEII